MLDHRAQTQHLIKRVRKPKLVFEFFFVFSRFGHALLHCGYFQKNREDASPDWDRFAKEHDGAFSPDSSEQLQEAVQYYENFPPKKQVIENDQLTVQDSIPQNQERLVRLVILLRRARNNLFHGEKFRGLLEGLDPQRDIKLLEYGLTILYACFALTPCVRDRFYSELV